MNLFPSWTILPFAALVLSLTALPLAFPKSWGDHRFQVAVALGCAAPVVVFLWLTGHREQLFGAAASYLSFIVTLGTLFVAASGVFVSGDLEATPRTNLAFLVGGALLASLIGTTGASILLIRPLLRTNQQRVHRAHLVPFFILAVSNAGGLLTPLGDPPLLLGYIEGVPFLWTLRLLPYWVLYVGAIGSLLYWTERKAYAREPAAAKGRDRAEIVPLAVLGKHNLLLLLGIVGCVVILPSGWREAAMVAAAAASYFGTDRSVRARNGFSFGPILEVAIVFGGLFTCLVPIEVNLAVAAPTLPLQHAWQLFWSSGLLSSFLDNAPTYAAFLALARGLHHGGGALVAGVSPIHLAAISVGSVVMGATTYIGNGPNLMVKAIAEKAGYPMPHFGRYALFAAAVLMPIHLVTTLTFLWLER